MTQLLLSTQSISPFQMAKECGEESVFSIHGLTNSMCPFRPYLTISSSEDDKRILNIINSTPQTSLECIAKISQQISPETTLATAEIVKTLKEYSIGSIGSGTTVYSERMNAFGRSVIQYQESLLRYAQTYNKNLAPRMKRGLKQNVLRTFGEMQRQFGNELKIVTSRINSKRGTPLTNPQRAMNIARSSKTISKLNVNTPVQAHNLVKFSKHSNMLGTGLVAIDFTTRVGNIHSEYLADGNWERQLFIESSSFAASTTTGLVAAQAGTAAIGFLMTLTPIGWVGLIIAGTAVIAGSTYASIKVNEVIQKDAGSIYDEIMQWIGSR
ncbi:MAG: hypothetical protein MI864_21360 [Pseudomonadales bacterium]|nr:hypothetical protein [Pseudomonadales bacterium]